MTVRRNSRIVDSDALVALLPDELRPRNGFNSLDEFNAHAAAVRAWANNQAPGLATDQLSPVMRAAGVTVADWFKIRLGYRPSA